MHNIPLRNALLMSLIQSVFAKINTFPIGMTSCQIKTKHLCKRPFYNFTPVKNTSFKQMNQWQRNEPRCNLRYQCWHFKLCDIFSQFGGPLLGSEKQCLKSSKWCRLDSCAKATEHICCRYLIEEWWSSVHHTVWPGCVINLFPVASVKNMAMTSVVPCF